MNVWQVSRLLLGVSATLLAVTMFNPSDATAQTVREVAVPGLPGIASVRYRGDELLVSYNPRTCKRLGPDLCSFFRAHEYGHIALRHLEKGTPVRQAEHEADVWAARNSTPEARAAAVRYFRSGGGASLRHGTGAQRASRVASIGTATPVRVAAQPSSGSRNVRRYSAVSVRPVKSKAVRKARPVPVVRTVNAANSRPAATQVVRRISTVASQPSNIQSVRQISPVPPTALSGSTALRLNTGRQTAAQPTQQVRRIGTVVSRPATTQAVRQVGTVVAPQVQPVRQIGTVVSQPFNTQSVGRLWRPWGVRN